MAESLTISRQAPEVKSMNYALLREKGVNRLQELAGNIWTDYNIHDPGVTILEALAYVITDLGYRSGYKIQDILAQDPSSATDIKNFFTAYEILTNRPLTLNDYRKLLMDVQITDDLTQVKVGVKNGWLLKAETSEVPFYVHASENLLSYDPDPLIPNQAPVKLLGLYNILLEFDENEVYGDMNANFIERVLPIVECSPLIPNPALVNKSIIITVTFPHWDEPGVDWNSQTSIRSFIGNNIKLDFSQYPDNYIFNYTILPVTADILFTPGACGIDVDRNGTLAGADTFYSAADLVCLNTQVNDLIFNITDSIVNVYQRKVKLILELVEEVRKSVMANRNLCEDFLSLNAVKVEEIGICGDIDIANDANVEEVLANIYHEVGKFLSPTVFFRTITEMVEKGKTMDEIFEGPRLKHGFIDDAELEKAKVRETIHVSDIYQIIMDVPGVIAVKNLQIANFPEQTDENIPSVSVKWCLDLAFDKNFVPRLVTDRSNITFYKDFLPFEADEIKVLEILEDLKSQDRLQRIENPVLDLPVPQGEFKEIETYTSAQEEFPLVYGIGTAGLPDSASPLRKAQAHQLKGFMMFFDQLLADYLSQLAHVKDLFSLNEARGNDGDFIIDRTYFTQTLFNIVPDAASLYVNAQPVHINNLNLIAEDQALFESRRNRFLDHLLARFAETFTDYALLAYNIDGPKAPEELIEDKLRFLNSYPEISYGRAGAFDYTDTCKLWSVDNVSGLEKRASLLAGIDPFKPSDLVFFPIFIEINDTLGIAPYSFIVKDFLSNDIMESILGYDTLDNVFIGTEKAIIAGLFPENYFIFDVNFPNVPIDPANPPTLTTFFYKLYCDGTPIARSNPLNTFATVALAFANAGLAFQTYQYEYERLPSSNRKDLDCALEDNIAISISSIITPGCPEAAQIDYIISNDTTDENLAADQLLTYSTRILAKPGETTAELLARAGEQAHDLLLDFFLIAVNRANYRTELIGTNYVFSVVDDCQETIASSVEFDFNFNLALFLTNNPGQVIVYDQNGSSLGNNPITSSNSNDSYIDILVTNSVTLTGGKITKDFTLPILAGDFDTGRRKFIVNEDLRGLVKAGEILSLTIGTNTADYTVTKVRVIDFASGAYRTEIVVKESFIALSTDTGSITHTASISILPFSVPTTTTALTLIGGVDQIAIDEFIDFIKTRFMDHEGMHLVEHILLRPTNKSIKVFEPAVAETITTPGTLIDGLSPQGDIYFVKTVTINAVSLVANSFTVAGNVTTEIVALQRILISGSTGGLNDRSFTIQSFVLSGPDTEITVIETISDDTFPFGNASFTKKVAIVNVVSMSNLIVVAGASSAGELLANDVIILSGSQDNKNDRRYTVGSTFVNPGGDTEITIDKFENDHKDKFLIINEISGCEDCRYEDPYSFIVSVILPRWRGRFSNFAFRKFFERTLRLEAPAHVVLNICWINCEQMKAFERDYKSWLYQHAKNDKDPVATTDALNKLIDTLQKLRSVYRKGTLHDCEDNVVRNSIILNQTQIGNI